MYGIRYNNKHSGDLGIQILDRSISTPAKKKIIEEIPFSNQVYDYSFLYDAQVFEQRKLEYTFFVNELFKDNLESKRIAIENWLYANHKKIKLIDDVTPGYYFLAECIEIDFENFKTYGTIKAVFEAYPFRIKNENEGEVIWNDFCFLTDTLQNTSFEVNGSRDIELVNNSILGISPIIVADSNFEIIKNNNRYLVKSGESESIDFKLSVGVNKLTIIGNGNISFNYKIEVV